MHTEISPSKLERVILCPGSVQLCRQIPKDAPNAAASRGTRLHEYTEQVINNAMNLNDIVDLEEHTQVEFAVNSYQALFEKWAGQAGEESAITYTEATVDIIQGFKESIVSGTSDVVLLGSKWTGIVDFKFGHTKVEAVENAQLMAYACGVYRTFTSWQSRLKHNSIIHMAIVQPALDSIEEYELTLEELHNWYTNVLLPAVKEALGPNPSINPGAVQCKWCPAVGVCPKAHELVQEQAQEVFKAYAKLDALEPIELSKLMSIIPALETAIKAIKNAAESMAGTNSLPGYKLVRKRGTRKWVDDSKVLEVLNTPEVEEKLVAKGLQFENLIDAKVKSPSQIEKMVGKAFMANIPGVLDCIELSEGALTLVTEDDERPNVVTSPFAEYAAPENGSATVEKN